MSPPSVSFETTLKAIGNNTGIVVPGELIEELGAGSRPAVLVNLNGHEFPNTVGVMRGEHMISVSAAIRKETGLQGGDAIKVVLTLNDTPRAVTIPDELESVFKQNPSARTFFDTLSNSLQRYHAENVAASKNSETRQRRAEKTIALFLAGRKR